MNIAFWLGVLVAIVVAWFCFAFAFKGIGGIGLNAVNRIKRIVQNKDESINETKENTNE